MGPAGGGEEREIEAQNLHQVKEILNRDSNLKEWLKVSGVAINGKLVTDLDHPLKEGDKIVILPPVCGG
ncbi:MAG: molybdopterin synthase sulfur carrier subunit [Epsilonproteobacteria bacterium]|nr:molybdopterin synthase sulfur carrier subunit [Campylobacterota bacterium]NPA88951.1 MoaD/ThiS family protein [Campylobacterota bacterium]